MKPVRNLVNICTGIFIVNIPRNILCLTCKSNLYEVQSIKIYQLENLSNQTLYNLMSTVFQPKASIVIKLHSVSPYVTDGCHTFRCMSHFQMNDTLSDGCHTF